MLVLEYIEKGHPCHYSVKPQCRSFWAIFEDVLVLETEEWEPLLISTMALTWFTFITTVRWKTARYSNNALSRRAAACKNTFHIHTLENREHLELGLHIIIQVNLLSQSSRVSLPNGVFIAHHSSFHVILRMRGVAAQIRKQDLSFRCTVALVALVVLWECTCTEGSGPH